MTTTPTPPAPTRAPPRRVEVARIADLTPRMRRITFTSPALEGFALDHPATHIKLFLPASGESEPLLPAFTPQGIVWPEGTRPAVRTYTPRAFRPETRELDVDFFVHGEGPASTWARTVQPSAKAGIAGPGKSHYAVAPDARGFVIAGDESAIPAIATILEALPSSARADVLIEVADATDELPFASPATLRVTWLHRGTAPGPEGTLLAKAIGDLHFSPDARYWVACEASTVREIRRSLLAEHGIPPKSLVTRGYWKRGSADHPDHDYGEDK